ncbi:MAG: 50S ribosomal protein L4 [Candidatus Paceibacterota bacterium]|jgi:large subunit ribosomal protein L4
MEAKVYNQEGKETGKVTLPRSVFSTPWNSDMVHQVITSMQSSAREPWADAKDRAEVAGGGIKPWKQKGTGRARHGSIRSPLWRHGGVTHGPLKERNYVRKVNKQMKTKALFAILSQKMKEGELLFVDSFNFGAAPKTKKAAESLVAFSKISGYEKIAYKNGSRALVLMGEANTELFKSFRNIQSAKIDEARNINPVDALQYKYIVIENPEKSLKKLANRA